METNSIRDRHPRLLSVSVAAPVLGVNDAAQHLRMPRQATATRVNADDRVFVSMPYDLTDYVRAGKTASEVQEDDAIENQDKPRPPPRPEPVAHSVPSGLAREPNARPCRRKPASPT